MTGENNYWQSYWRKRLTRRGLLRGTALGAAGLAAAAVVGCGGDEEAATPTPGGSPGATKTTAGSPAGSPAAAYPAPPKYSNLPGGKLVEDYHWGKLGPTLQEGVAKARMGGVAAFAGLVTEQTMSPIDPGVPFGQWSFCYTHSNLVGMNWDYKTGNPDLLPPFAKYGLS